MLPFITYYERYVKATNIDGVKRKLTHNAYIYSSSNRRTSHGGKWKLQKGQTIVTYGGSYKFKNGKRYYRIGGPVKQYVKASNLGPVIGYNDVKVPEETTATLAYTSDIYDSKGNVVKSNVKAGTKFTVDRLDSGLFTRNQDMFEADDRPDIYRIKGTNNWLLSSDVKVADQLPLHNYENEHYSYITFPKDTDVYNADGTMQYHNGQKISEQKGWLKVNRLTYIWVPSENKADLFYHLVGQGFYASVVPNSNSNMNMIEVGPNAYVKASDVKFGVDTLQLAPDNTPEEAKAAAQSNSASSQTSSSKNTTSQK